MQYILTNIGKFRGLIYFCYDQDNYSSTCNIALNTYYYSLDRSITLLLLYVGIWWGIPVVELHCNYFGCNCDVTKSDPPGLCMYTHWFKGAWRECRSDEFPLGGPERCEAKRFKRSAECFELLSKYKNKPALRAIAKFEPFKFFAEVDVDADGLISYKETLDFNKRKNLQEHKESAFTTLENMTSYLSNTRFLEWAQGKFKEMDTNLDGYIPPGEFDQQL